MVYDWLKRHQQRCLLCTLPTQGKHGICDGCRGDLPWLNHHCRGCALPIPAPASFCGRCLKTPSPLNHCSSLFYYRYPAQQLIIALKFNEQLAIARLLGQLLAEKIRQQQPCHHVQAVVPVPLHHDRLRQRGYNQSREIAKYCAQHLQLPLINNLLERNRATAQQSQLSRSEREKNLKGAFRVLGKGPDSILLVDDVMTSGATLMEMAKTLRQSGTKEIQAWTICRAVLE